MLMTPKAKDGTVGVAMSKLREQGLLVPEAMASSTLKTLHAITKPTGIWNNKAKWLRNMSKAILKNMGRNVPQSMDELMKIKGVGQKIALVMLHEGYNLTEGIAVDSHLAQIFKSLGWTAIKSSDKKAAEDVQTWLPSNEWGDTNRVYAGIGQMIRDKKKNCMILE